MIETMKELFPGTEPRVDVNDKDLQCWNKDGHSNSIQMFLADPTYRI